ncbi:hypothetical protein Glove_628g20 [Diversispora epigaea]|uniref:Uncharacterized protein n=1 Tax=Diversispora epigaea TaxID=1348612 RepID=A0A397G5A8_9GLOM|nr:hypothetical protein Glove_628g20 [Diversispora epigaea]
MTNIQSKIDLLKQRAIDLEVENAKLKQIIKENAKRKADNVNLSAENAKVKIELRRAMGENAKLKAESLREVKTRERIEKTMLELDGSELVSLTLKMVRRLRSGATHLSPEAISDIITAKGALPILAIKSME